jgi:hypothetical protein
MNRERIPFLLLLVVVVSGMVALAFSMHWGPGVGGDSTIYISSAENLLKGKGLGLFEPDSSFRLLPYFPPFFPLLLSLLGWLGLDPLISAFWINLLTFGGLIWMAGLLSLQAGEKAWVALATAAVIGFSPILIPAFSWAMSEPLSILLGFASFFVLMRYLENRQRRWLAFSAALAGLSFLTRYSSVAFLVAGFLGVAWFTRKGNLHNRLADLLLYGFLSVLPMAIWMVVDISLTSTVASRSMESGIAERLSNLLPKLKEVFNLWFLPQELISNPPYPQFLNPLGLTVAALFILGLGVLIFLKVMKTTEPIRDDRRARMSVILSIFIFTYVAVIAVVYVTTYPPITIGSRMLSPVHAAFVWLVCLLASLTAELFKKWRWVKPAVIVFMFFFTAWYGVRSVRIVAQNYDEGLGYLSHLWQESETIQAVKNLPADTILVSNEPTAIVFLTGRLSYTFKESYSNEPLQTFTAYGEGDLEGDEGQAAFKENGAALVLFENVQSQLHGLYDYRTEERMNVLLGGLYHAFSGPDGDIYFYSEP